VIDKLEFLLALAREKHFGRAAEACGVTQPTLSAGVKHLEEQMGVLLVKRGSRFQGFTPEGERVLEWARRIVGDSRAMREDISALRHGLSGRLRIAAIPTALAMVAAITTPYRDRHPNVQFTVYSRTSLEILDLLENLEIDAGITYIGNEPIGRVSIVPLYQEHYRLVTSADAPLGDRDSVTWAEVSSR
jgi:DNA-binding transcriptional LysR family regulator